MDRALHGEAAPPPAVLLAHTAWRQPKVYGGGDACDVVPPSRWEVDLDWSDRDREPKRFGAFVDGADLFDAEAFGISAQEVGI